MNALESLTYAALQNLSLRLTPVQFLRFAEALDLDVLPFLFSSGGARWESENGAYAVDCHRIARAATGSLLLHTAYYFALEALESARVAALEDPTPCPRCNGIGLDSDLILCDCLAGRLDDLEPVERFGLDLEAEETYLTLDLACPVLERAAFALEPDDSGIALD